MITMIFQIHQYYEHNSYNETKFNQLSDGPKGLSLQFHTKVFCQLPVASKETTPLLRMYFSIQTKNNISSNTFTFDVL